VTPSLQVADGIIKSTITDYARIETEEINLYGI